MLSPTFSSELRPDAFRQLLNLSLAIVVVSTFTILPFYLYLAYKSEIPSPQKTFWLVGLLVWLPLVAPAFWFVTYWRPPPQRLPP